MGSSHRGKAGKSEELPYTVCANLAFNCQVPLEGRIAYYLNLLIAAGQVGEYIGAQALTSSLPGVDLCSGNADMAPIGSGKR